MNSRADHHDIDDLRGGLVTLFYVPTQPSMVMRALSVRSGIHQALRSAARLSKASRDKRAGQNGHETRFTLNLNHLELL